LVRSSRAWYFVALVAAAIAISYFDRQTLPVAISAIQRSIRISDAQFGWLQAAFLSTYALMYVGGGKLLDAIGTRAGFALIMIWWSLACALQGLANGLPLLVTARLLLGMGEGGGFPAATRVVAEWLPPEQRSTGMGIINAGTAVGSVLAPPLIGLILWLGNWRDMFFVSGGLGLLWAVWWLAAFHSKRPASSSSAADLVPSIPWSRLLGSRRVLGLVVAKFLSDSAWYFYLFWLPKYLYDARGFDIRHVSYFGWIPYAASGVGSLLGGWYSSHLMHTGHSLNFSRKLALGLSAALMPAVMLVPRAPISFALVLFSIVFFGQQSWSGLIMTLPADIFPLSSVGSVAGLIGFGGAVGGATFGVVAGELLGHGAGYSTLFFIAGSLHLLAFGIILLTSGILRAPTNDFNASTGALALP
jgi:ACS family hexuronate transporter-like MFS transporter